MNLVDAGSAEALLSIAQERWEEVVAFLQDLVRIRSVNGRDDELAVAQRIAEEADRLELEARLIGAEPNRHRSFGRLRQRRCER